MTSLKSKFELKSNEELIEAVESVDMYTLEAVGVALEVLQERNILPASLIELSKVYWQDHFSKNLRSYLKKGDPPKSKFLSEEELKEIIHIQFEEYVERKDLMSVDSTKYWFIG